VPSAPLEPRIIRYELVEVRHELVDSFSHVHVPYAGPYRVCVRQYSRLVLVRADRGLELVPADNTRYNEDKRTKDRDTYVYLDPSSMGSRSFAIA
jgi:hypothetical protein